MTYMALESYAALKCHISLEEGYAALQGTLCGTTAKEFFLMAPPLRPRRRAAAQSRQLCHFRAILFVCLFGEIKPE